MIKPTVGRVVLYRPMDHEPSVRHAATVAYVNNDGTVNLSVVNCFGVQYSVQGVTLIADPAKVPVEGQAEWMAYQHAQASINPIDPPSALSFFNVDPASIPKSGSLASGDGLSLADLEQSPVASSGVPGDMDDDEVDNAEVTSRPPRAID